LTGLYFGIRRGYKALESIIQNRIDRAKAIIPAAVFACAVVNLPLKLYMA